VFAARVEMMVFLSLYLITLALQLLTTGSVLQQGSTALVALTAVHAGALAATFWTLLGMWLFMCYFLPLFLPCFFRCSFVCVFFPYFLNYKLDALSSSPSAMSHHITAFSRRLLPFRKQFYVTLVSFAP
jgi:hypothetical protein